MDFFQPAIKGLYKTFVYQDRWQWFVSGIGYTLLISLVAVLLGLFIGTLAAFGKLSRIKPLKWISGMYVDIIRGTPTVVQMLIIYYVIFASVNIEPWVAGALGFSINSGAYIAEIVRGGILSIDKGQSEAGRSLGLSGAQTMLFIVLPQTVKNILPALANEFIVLIKETAVIGMINNIDLLGAAQRVESITFDYLWPMLSVAAIYYIIIKILSIGLNILEEHLRKSDIR